MMYEGCLRALSSGDTASSAAASTVLASGTFAGPMRRGSGGLASPTDMSRSPRPSSWRFTASSGTPTGTSRR
eukprot:4305745-Pyramimonas_sp.AAC.1